MIGQRKISTTHVLNNKSLLNVFCTFDICLFNLMASGDSSTGSMGDVLTQLIIRENQEISLEPLIRHMLGKA